MRVDRTREILGGAVLDAHEYVGDDTILVNPDSLHDAMQTLRDHKELHYNLLIDLTAVDYLGREPRFEVVYHLASLEAEPRGSEPSRLVRRLRVKVGVPEVPCEVASVTDLWAAANWMEREVFDLYGIRFEGHPDLRRILLYDEFEGHPLRKDYPKEKRQPLVGPRN